jgi:hypothetical protein
MSQSKGGELALLLASRYPFIKKVAAFVPHAYSFQGLAFKNVSSYGRALRPVLFGGIFPSLSRP